MPENANFTKKILDAALNRKCSGVQGPARPRRRFDKRICSMRGRTKFFLPSLLPGAGQHFWSTQFASVLVQVQGWSRFLYQQFYKLFAFSAAAWRDDIQYELCITLFKNIPKKKHNLQSISWFHNFRLNHHLPWQPLAHGLKPNLFWWLRCTCLCWSWLLNR